MQSLLVLACSHRSIFPQAISSVHNLADTHIQQRTPSLCAILGVFRPLFSSISSIYSELYIRSICQSFGLVGKYIAPTMPTLEHFDVCILVSRKELLEFEDHNISAPRLRNATRYIEVEEGDKFEVQLKLLKGFAFYGGKYVHVGIDVDTDSWFDTFLKAGTDCLREGSSRSILQRGTNFPILVPKCLYGRLAC